MGAVAVDASPNVLPVFDTYATINLLEHLPHPLDVVVIQEPCLWVSLVFFEGDTKGVGDVHCLAVVLAQEDTDYAFVW